MKNLFVISILIVCVYASVAQKIDTIYYDVNWKGVPKKDLASFMRIAYLPSDSQEGTAKDFYITGELQSEGLIPLYIDKNDDHKSKFKGHHVNYYKSGKKKYELYKNDSSQLEGERIDYYENGSIKSKGTYKNNQLDGEATFYYENGSIEVKETYQNNQLEGDRIGYYENGSIKDKSTYRNNQLDGEATVYYKNGNTEGVMVYQKGECIESTNFNENGLKVQTFKGTYKNGEFNDGESIAYYENGLRKVKGTLKNGKWDGTYYQFNIDGSYCELEMIDGQPNKYYYLVGVNGKRTKLKHD